MKRLIIINGTMGVGKTATCRQLNKSLDNSVWLDGDWCWMMDPFIVNEETKSLVTDNITHMLRNFLNLSHIENVIFNWVIDKDEIFDIILEPLKDLEFELYKITLVCSDSVLINRISRDVQSGKRNSDCISRSIKRQPLYKKINTIKINTDNNTIEDNVREIQNILLGN